MKCPNCKEPNLILSERQGIEIDYCPDCRGIWLDRGELDKILEKAAKEFEAVNSHGRQENYQRPPSQHQHQPQQQPYPPNYHPGYYQKPYYKRKKSFFEELFD